MFYKVIKNNLIIDVGTSFLRWQKRNSIILGSEVHNANYLQTDNKMVYETDWLKPPTEGAPRYERVIAVEIDEEEYNNLKIILGKEITIEIPKNTEEGKIQTVEEIKILPLDYSSASTLLLSLTEQYNKLLEKNALLEECILELSQELYK